MSNMLDTRLPLALALWKEPDAPWSYWNTQLPVMVVLMPSNVSTRIEWPFVPTLFVVERHLEYACFIRKDIFVIRKLECPAGIAESVFCTAERRMPTFSRTGTLCWKALQTWSIREHKLRVYLHRVDILDFQLNHSQRYRALSKIWSQKTKTWRQNVQSDTGLGCFAMAQMRRRRLIITRQKKVGEAPMTHASLISHAWRS